MHLAHPYNLLATVVRNKNHSLGGCAALAPRGRVAPYAIGVGPVTLLREKEVAHEAHLELGCGGVGRGGYGAGHGDDSARGWQGQQRHRGEVFGSHAGGKVSVLL